MFLYNKKGKYIEVYDFNANMIDVINYRMAQMEQIPEEERYFFAETKVSPYGETPILEQFAGHAPKNQIVSSTYVDNEKRQNHDPYGRYHVLKKDTSNPENHEVLLIRYYYGSLTDKNAIQVQYRKTARYFLLCKNFYTYLGEKDGGKNYRMEDIIQLPESLYLLQLIEQERFAFLRGKDVSEPLKLYQSSKINEVSIEELRKMDECGITKDAYPRTIAKANNDALILKLIKNQ